MSEKNQVILEFICLAMFSFAMYLEIRAARKNGNYQKEKERISICKIIGVVYALMAIQAITKLLF